MHMEAGPQDDAFRAKQAKRGSPFLNTKQAAFYLDLSVRTLEKWRSKGRGPKVHYHGGAARYHIGELDQWSDTSGHSTRRRHHARKLHK